MNSDKRETHVHTVGGGRISLGKVTASTFGVGHEGAIKPATDATISHGTNVRFLSSAGAGAVILAEIVVSSLKKVSTCFSGSYNENECVVHTEKSSEDGTNLTGSGF